MKECTLKELIDELPLIYNKYGDIGVCKDDECGGLLYILKYIHNNSFNLVIDMLEYIIYTNNEYS